MDENFKWFNHTLDVINRMDTFINENLYHMNQWYADSSSSAPYGEILSQIWCFAIVLRNV